jgi:NADH-quinone oxidoreductase subunit L
MGGLRRVMPHTTLVFIVGTLALAGVWPFAGFFSKEAILDGVVAGGRPGVFVLLVITAFLTAFYMSRVVFITFFGHGHPHGAGHPHDPPWLMRGPLWLLAALTVLIGVRFVIGAPGDHHPPAWLTVLSLALALGGIALAWGMYGAGRIPVELVRRPFAFIDVLARRRYFLDAIYEGVYRGLMLGFSRVVGWVDRYFVDGLLNVASAWSLRAGDALRRIQSGQAQDYVYGVAFGVLLLLVWAQWWRSP